MVQFMIEASCRPVASAPNPSRPIHSCRLRTRRRHLLGPLSLICESRLIRADRCPCLPLRKFPVPWPTRMLPSPRSRTLSATSTWTNTRCWSGGYSVAWHENDHRPAEGQGKRLGCLCRSVGHVNFLDDPSRVPHCKPEVRVAESTRQNKSRAIGKALKMGPMSPKWTLPSRLADNH